jgi:hypothetical protein
VAIIFLVTRSGLRFTPSTIPEETIFSLEAVHDQRLMMGIVFADAYQEQTF